MPNCQSAVPLGIVLAVVVSGCGASQPEKVTNSFLAALANERPGDACRYIEPGAWKSYLKDNHVETGACPDALRMYALYQPDAMLFGKVDRVTERGHSARVQIRGDNSRKTYTAGLRERNGKWLIKVWPN